MKHVSYGIPLAVLAAGTVISIFLPVKRLHVAFGTAFIGLSVLHACQHKRKLSADTNRICVKGRKILCRKDGC